MLYRLSTPLLLLLLPAVIQCAVIIILLTQRLEDSRLHAVMCVLIRRYRHWLGGVGKTSATPCYVGVGNTTANHIV